MTKIGAFVTGVVFAGVVCAGFSFYQQREYKKDKVDWQAQMDARAKKEAEARAEAERYHKLSDEHLEAADVWHLKADEFKRAWEIALGQASYWQGQAETLPPDSVVSETAVYIPVAITEIKLMANGSIAFSLVAARSNLNNLYQYKAVLIPAFDKLKGESVALRKEVGELKDAAKDFGSERIKWGEERSDLITDRDSYKGQLAKCESRVIPKFSLGLNIPTVAVGVGGVILGVVIFSLVHK